MSGIFEIIYVVAVVLLMFGAAIFIHEFGHFWVALKRGLKVEEFAIGFGPVVWSKEKDGILYSIRAIPAGGFVKLPQMLTSEAIEGKADDEDSEEGGGEKEPEEPLPPVSPLSKILVAFAGPFMNVVFALVIAIGLWILGIPKVVDDPVVGYVGQQSEEYQLGVRSGHLIKTVNGEKVETWQDVNLAVLDSADTGKKTVSVVFEENGKELEPKDLPADTWNGEIRHIRLEHRAKLIVQKVQTDSVFASTGFEPGDVVQSVNGQTLYSHYQMVDLMMAADPAEKDVVVKRGDDEVTLKHTAPDSAGVLVASVPKPEHGTWDLMLSKVGKDLGELEDTPAMKAGMKKGDRILEANGHRITSSRQLVDIIRNYNEGAMPFVIQRDGVSMDLNATPQDGRLGVALDDGVGIVFKPEVTVYSKEYAHPTPWQQFLDVFNKIAITFKALASGSESGVGAKHLSGPVGIFGMLAIQVKQSPLLALSFLVLLNLNLAILNLLPVPVLDGGHIVMSVIEWIRKRPVSMKIQEYATTAFALLLITFFVYVTIADVKRVPLLHEFFQRDTEVEQVESGK